MDSRAFALSLAAATFGLASRAAAAPDTAPAATSVASRITMSGELGYAYPLGSAENGTATGDVSFGLVPLVIAGRYDLGHAWDTGLRLQYAANIPTLAGSVSDGAASIGDDIRVSVSVGRTLPRWRRFTPHVGLTLGWEWLTTKLSDAGVVASRSWNGPAFGVEIFVDVGSRGAWSLGPVLALDAGIFTHVDLDTPAWHTDGPTSAALHFWPVVAFRVARRL